MSTREERRRARRLAIAAGTHWIAAAADIDNRIYAAMRAADLPGGKGHVDSDERTCRACRHTVVVDKRLIRLADRAKAILCLACIAKHENKTPAAVMMDQINYDNGEEI
jgi:hypothetical protein